MSRAHIARADLAQCLRPIDRVAARVTFSHDWYNSCKRVVAVNSSTPLRLIRVPLASKDRTGVRHGRLVVVGLHEIFKKKGHRWSCRCECGNYTIRTGAVLTRNVEDDACCRCKHNDFLIRKRQYREGAPVTKPFSQEKDARP
jgi:hypothetical protein